MLGDGEGSRYVLEVDEANGVLRVIRGDSYYGAHEPFRSWLDQAEIDADTMLRRQPGGEEWML